MVNKKVGILLGGVGIFLVCTLLYVKVNPPLFIRGVSSNAVQADNMANDKGEPFVIVANAENNGLGDIRLKEVLINANEKPDRVELGVGRSNHLVMVKQARGDIDEDEKISFHRIHEFPIKPVVQSEDIDSDTIKHYGIAVSHNGKINSLVINYSYFGIPLELKLDLNEE